MTTVRKAPSGPLVATISVETMLATTVSASEATIETLSARYPELHGGYVYIFGASGGSIYANTEGGLGTTRGQLTFNVAGQYWELWAGLNSIVRLQNGVITPLKSNMEFGPAGSAWGTVNTVTVSASNVSATTVSATGILYGALTVSLGAADSAGSGYRLLRVPN